MRPDIAAIAFKDRLMLSFSKHELAWLAIVQKSPTRRSPAGRADGAMVKVVAGGISRR